MTLIGTETFKSDDLGDGTTWTYLAGADDNLVDDQHNALAGIQSDEVNDRWYSTASGGSEIGDDNITGCFWAKLGTQTKTAIPICQYEASLNKDAWVFYMFTDGTVRCDAMTATPSNSVLSRSSTTYDDDTWRHYFFTIEKLASGNADINIYVDGSEVTYAVGKQDKVNGSGFTGFTETNDIWMNGHSFSTGSECVGILSRPRLWRSTVGTSAEVLAYYQNELALIGSGDGGYMANYPILFS